MESVPAAAVEPSAPSAPSGPPPGGRRYLVRRWHSGVKARRTTALAYRVGVGVLGGAILAIGIFLVPLPGPGWLIVFIGLSVLASEFAWAERLLGYARARVTAWTRWLGRRSLPVRLLVGLTGVALLAAAVLGYAARQGLLPADLPLL